MTDAQAMRPPTMSALIDRAASAPGGAGLIWNEGVVPYAALAERSRRIASGLSQAGVSPGDHVAIWAPNSPDYLAGFLARSRLGVGLMLLNLRLSSHEVADILMRSDSRALFYARIIWARKIARPWRPRLSPRSTNSRWRSSSTLTLRSRRKAKRQ